MIAINNDKNKKAKLVFIVFNGFCRIYIFFYRIFQLRTRKKNFFLFK